MTGLISDARYGWRRLRAAPLFTVAAILMLAIGIGANVSLFTVVYGLLLRPLPYPDAERIVIGGPIAPAVFLAWQRDATAFTRMAAYRSGMFDVATDGTAERVSGVVVSAQFFDVAGVTPSYGRTIGEADSTGARVAVIGRGYWTRHFGADSAIVGRRILIDGEASTVIGVMPAGFALPFDAEIWMPARHRVPEHPLRPVEDPTPLRAALYLGVCGRLAPNATLESAAAERRVLVDRLARQFPDEVLADDVAFPLRTLRDWIAGDLTTPVLLLMGAVGVLLLTICANLANLLLARAVFRRGELALRSALGASAGRIVRLVLIEGLMLSGSGGVAGVVLAAWLLPLMLAAASGDLATIAPRLDGSVLFFAVVISAGTGLLVGSFPAATAFRPRSSDLLGGDRMTGGGVRRGLWQTLIGLEFATAATLMVGAAVISASYRQVIAADTGFSPEGVLVAPIDLPAHRYSDPASQARFFDALLQRVRAEPGLEQSAAAARVPFSGADSTRGITIAGSTARDAWAGIRVVSPQYFRVLNIQLRRGRPLLDSDRSDSPGATVINQAMASRYWPGRDPLGQRFRLGTDGAMLQVVGEIADTKYGSLREPAEPEFYVSFRQQPWAFMSILIRTPLTPLAVSRSIAHALQGIDPALAPPRAGALAGMIRASASSERFTSVALSASAGVTAIVALLGLYGVTAYVAARRRREIGIRMALGASAGRVGRLVAIDALIPLTAGIVAGLASAAVARALLRSTIVGLGGSSPGAVAAAIAALLVCGLMVAIVPAWRATRQDPVAALRE